MDIPRGEPASAKAADDPGETNDRGSGAAGGRDTPRYRRAAVGRRSTMALREARLLSAGVLLSGLVVLAIVLRLHLYSVLFLSGSVVAATVVFLLYTYRLRARRGAEPESRRTRSPRSVHRLESLVTMAFFLLTAGSLLAAIHTPYAKSELYYVLVAGCAAALVSRIALLQNPREVPFTLVMLGVLTLNIFGSDQLAFPLGIGGADAPAHIDALVLPIASTGFVPVGACGGSALIYFFFPASQVYVASSALLFSTNPINTFYLMGFLGMAVAVLLLFVIARPLIGTRAALLASVLLAGSSYYIFWAAHASATTFAIPLIATFILVLRELHQREFAVMLIASAILSLALVLTHPYSSVIFGIILAGIAVGHVVTRHQNHAWIWGVRISAAIFLCTLLIEWTNFSCLAPTALGFIRNYITTLTGHHLVASAGTYDVLPLRTLFTNTFADSLLLTLSIIGFFLLYARGFSKAIMLLVGSGIALLAVTLVGLLTNLVYLLPARVYAYLQLIALAPLGAVALSTLQRQKQEPDGTEPEPVRIIVSIVIVGVLVFGSSASTIAGFETSPFTSGQLYQKLYNTQYEVASADWLCQHLDNATVVDFALTMQGLSKDQVGRCTKPQGTVLQPLKVTPESAINLSAIKPGQYVWYSGYDVTTAFQYQLTAIGRYGAGVYKRLSPTAVDSLEGFDSVYSNGEIQVFWNQVGAG